MKKRKDLNLNDGSIQCFSGEVISIITPELNNYKIIDIAKGLGYKPHFVGQTPYFFSIAEHCLLADDLYVQDKELLEEKPDPKLRLAILLHDASEAYIVDMPKPYKHLMPEFQKFEDAMTSAIFTAFNIPILSMVEVKPYDNRSKELEYKNFNNRVGSGLLPDEAVKAFISRISLINAEIKFNHEKRTS